MTLERRMICLTMKWRNFRHESTLIFILEALNISQYDSLTHGKYCLVLLSWKYRALVST